VTDATAIEDVLRGLVRSAEPAVVLSSLARHSQQAFSDACAIELSEGTDALFHVSFPATGRAGKTVTTAFELASGHGYASFAGVAVHTWTSRDPTADDAIIARLLVAHALGVVQQERLAWAAARAEERAAKLAVELITSRSEGEAIGLLMARHGATRAEAVSMLRRPGGPAGDPDPPRPLRIAGGAARSSG